MRLRQQPEGIGNFNPRPPRGGRLGLLPHLLHALGFQSTPPARGATVKMKVRRWSMSISIHAPREGGDGNAVEVPFSSSDFNPRPPRGGRLTWACAKSLYCDFNPRPPRGGRQFPLVSPDGYQGFQSTPPARGATPCFTISKSPTLFQSTPPARGATQDHHRGPRRQGHFNPRPPRGGRRAV